MYKIYHNEKLICLLHHVFSSLIKTDGARVLKVPYSGNRKILMSVLDKLEKNDELEEVFILTHDVSELMNDFKSLFTIIRASGGLVCDTSANILLIYRRGFWDLPKGKIDAGESKKGAALREVLEETGLEQVQILQRLLTTYHIYREDRKTRILKPTFWYLMYSTSQELKPEAREGIEKAIWVDNYSASSKKYVPMYKNIQLVIDDFNHLKNHLSK